MARPGASSRLEPLVDRVRRAPEVLPRFTVSGPGGSGLSEALDLLASVLDEATVEIHRLRGRAGEQDADLAALEELTDAAGDERVARDRLLERLAGGSVLLVDDAQWLDVGSTRVLGAVADRTDERSIGMIVAHRPQRSSPELAALGAVLARDEAPVVLEPLDEEQAADRLARLLDAPTEDALVAALLEESGGHLLWFDLLARSWRAEGAIERGSLRERPARLPGAVVEHVRVRLDLLSREERILLGVLVMGGGLDDMLLSELAAIAVDDLGPAIDGMTAAGILPPDGGDAVPLVREVVIRTTPDPERRRLHARLASCLEERGAPATVVAEHVWSAGGRDADAGRLFVRAGDDVLADAPAEAGVWYARAVEAGAPPGLVAVRQARTEALTGDPGHALALADRAMAVSRGAEQSAAADVAAAVLTARGAWEPARRVVEVVGGRSEAGAVAQALLGLTTGDRESLVDARAMAAAPTLAGEVVRLLVDGLLGSVDADGASTSEVLRPFMAAADLLEARGSSEVLAESPHALGAVLALHAGDLVVADQLLARAVEHDVGGALLRVRHRLLRAWSAVRAGRWTEGESALSSVRDEATAPRDRLLVVALGSALARRSGDVAALAAAWREAEPVVVGVVPDLTAVEMLGELDAAAARLDTWDRVAQRRREVEVAIERLGVPGLWALPLRWAAVQSAVAAGQVDRLRTAVTSLERAASVYPAGPALVLAGRAWVSVLDDAAQTGATASADPDTAAVEAAASALEGVGLAWEASRLVGQAAVRVSDAGLTRSLLGRARDLRDSVPTDESAMGDALSGLSDREQEVARLVADGLTYKEIGSQLFISPKTVEHHVAKIRQKLGADTRAEMLAALRAP